MRYKDAMRKLALFNPVVGFVGVGLGVYNAWMYSRVLSSPGDDNPIALLLVASVLASVVPGGGLVRWMRRARLGTVTGVVWLVLSVLIVASLVPFSLMFF